MLVPTEPEDKVDEQEKSAETEKRVEKLLHVGGVIEPALGFILRFFLSSHDFVYPYLEQSVSQTRQAEQDVGEKEQAKAA